MGTESLLTKSLFRGGEGSALWLVDSLNDLTGTPTKEQISQLILDLNDLRRLVRTEEAVDGQGRLVGSRAVALFRKISSQLLDVKWSPYPWWSQEKTYSVKKGLTFNWGPLGSAPDEGQFMMGVAFNLADSGLLRRVRKCGTECKQCLKRNCGRWFYARSRNSRFCSERCRIAHHRRHTPRGRATNRKSQSDFRKRAKLRDEEAKRAAKEFLRAGRNAPRRHK